MADPIADTLAWYDRQALAFARGRPALISTRFMADFSIASAWGGPSAPAAAWGGKFDAVLGLCVAPARPVSSVS